MHDLFLISDSSGNLIEHYFNAILTQFPKKCFRIRSLSFVDSDDRLLEVLEEIDDGIVAFALVQKTLQDQLIKRLIEKGLLYWDVTTPAVEFLEKASRVNAKENVEALHTLNDAYMGRMAAIEFALQHDDNRRLDQLKEAEIVLVGISRVSKSPNALFLGYRGFKVANVSLVPSEGLPKPLRKHRKKNVVALTIQPKKLAEIRQRRFSNWNLDNFDYDDLPSVIHEVRDAEDIYKNKKWPIIDTTNLAVEETSSLILDTLKLKPRIHEKI